MTGWHQTYPLTTTTPEPPDTWAVISIIGGTAYKFHAYPYDDFQNLDFGNVTSGSLSAKKVDNTGAVVGGWSMTLPVYKDRRLGRRHERRPDQRHHHSEPEAHRRQRTGELGEPALRQLPRGGGDQGRLEQPGHDLRHVRARHAG